MPQTFCLGDRSIRVLCEIGRHFDADKTVGAPRGIEYRTQDVGCVANIFDRERFENLPRRMVMALQHALDRVVIFVGLANGVFKNRRIRCDAPQAVLIDQLCQSAIGNEAAGEKIKPHRLAMILQCFQLVHNGRFPAISVLAI